jgi:exopolysaccharide biosynthesis predicted pyruvyltransferase EpsI
VRNAFTAELVEKTTGKRPKIICDPTLATDLPTESLSDITTPYILLYVINRPRNLTLAQQVIDFWKKTNSDKIPIYSITPAELKGQETLTVDRAIYDISPFQWHYLIANANLVITDSFHGTIFSLKNHRNFAILNNNLKTASRFKSLLRDVDLEERIINGENEIYKIQNSLESNWAIVDYTIVKMSQAYHEFVANELTNSNKVN